MPRMSYSMSLDALVILDMIEDPTLPVNMKLTQAGVLYVRGQFIEETRSYLSINPMVLDWANRVVTNGGAYPSTPTISSINTFYNNISSSNLISKMLSVNCYAPDSIIAAITPLIHVSGSDPWTNTNFSGSDLTINGLAGSSSKYLNTGIPTTDFSYTSMGCTMYVYSKSDAGQAIGSYNNASPPTAFQIIPDLPGSFLVDYPMGVGVAARINVVNSTYGYFCISRTASNRIDLYKANSVVTHSSIANNTSTVPDFTFGSYPFYVHAANYNNSPVGFSRNRLSFMAFHSGLNITESSNLYNAVQTLRTNLGGGYI